MKLKKFKIIKTLALFVTTGVLVATPIITTSCSTSSTKSNVSINENLNVVGNISNVINEQGNLDLESYLANNADKFINGYNEQTYGKVNVKISNFENKSDKWGTTPYEQWQKLSTGTPGAVDSEEKSLFSLDEKDNKLYKATYQETRMTISSWNDLHDELNKVIEKINNEVNGGGSSDGTEEEGNEEVNLTETTIPSKMYYSLDKDAALGFDNNDSTIHVKLNVTDAKIESDSSSDASKNQETGTKPNLLGSIDFSIPMAYIVFKTENINVQISGEKINTVSTTIKSLTCDFTVKSELNYQVEDEIIIDKDLQSVTIAPTANSTMVALGWAEYSKIHNPTPLKSVQSQEGGSSSNPSDKEIKINEEAIWKDLKVSGITFSKPTLKQNDDKTYKLELKMTPYENLQWDDGTNAEKTFVLDNLKLATRSAILTGTSKDYSSSTIEIDDLSKVEEYIRTNIEKITDAIQTDLTKPTTGGEQPVLILSGTATSPMLLNGTISLNKDKTIEVNKTKELETKEAAAEEKTIQLVYDVNANKGHVFFDDNSKQKQITITLKFTKKAATEQTK